MKGHGTTYTNAQLHDNYNATKTDSTNNSDDEILRPRANSLCQTDFERQISWMNDLAEQMYSNNYCNRNIMIGDEEIIDSGFQDNSPGFV